MSSAGPYVEAYTTVYSVQENVSNDRRDPVVTYPYLLPSTVRTALNQ